MRTQEEVDVVLGYLRQGLTASEAARITGIPRSTVRDWGDERCLQAPRSTRLGCSGHDFAAIDGAGSWPSREATPERIDPQRRGRASSRPSGRARTSGAPRYAFRDRSEDILEIFRRSCELAGIHCTRASPTQIAVYRKTAVARLDEFVGPKS